MRKIFVIVILIVALATLFFFLNNSNTDSKNNITLNLIGEALPPLESLGKLAKKYEEKTGVELIIHPYEFQTALNKAQLDFESNNYSYDLVMGIFYNHGKYYKNGYITPFSSFDKTDKTVPLDNFYKPLQDVCMTYDNEVIGYPFSAQTMFLWFRKDLFTNEKERVRFKALYDYELPIPDENNLLDWEQYEDLAEFFTRKKGDTLGSEILNEDFYGTTLQLKRHPCSFYELTNFIYSFGGSFFDKDGNSMITSEENIEALTYYLNLKNYSPKGVTQFTWDDALAQMQQGKIAMTIMWSDAPSALDDPEQSKVVGKVGYSLVPIKKGIDKKVSVFGGWAFLINDKSKYKKEAYDFVQWACSEETQLKWAKQGGLPASKNIFEDEEYLSIPYMKSQNEALKNLVSWPRYPEAESFISKGEIALSKSAVGEMTPREALEWLDMQVNPNYEKKEKELLQAQ